MMLKLLLLMSGTRYEITAKLHARDHKKCEVSEEIKGRQTDPSFPVPIKGSIKHLKCKKNSAGSDIRDKNETYARIPRRSPYRLAE